MVEANKERQRTGWLIGLGAAVLLLSTADHWTTYLCLRQPVEGFHVIESNPLSRWLFTRIGLGLGLAVDGVITLMAVGLLVHTQRVPTALKVCFLGGVCAWTAAAVMNNYQILRSLGLTTQGTLGG